METEFSFLQAFIRNGRMKTICACACRADSDHASYSGCVCFYAENIIEGVAQGAVKG